MDNWSAIAPMLIGFHQTAPQRSGEAKAMTDAASKSPGCPRPDCDLIELRRESLVAQVERLHQSRHVPQN
jgi:hypothetical protein